MLKRRLPPLLAAMALLLSLLPAASAAPGGRIDGVDYGRIQENVRLRLPVEFQIGDRVFRGFLQNGNTLTPEEADAVIKGVMNEMEITSGVLEFSERLIRQAAAAQGFNPEVVLELGLRLTGMDTVRDVYEVAAGRQQAAGAIANYVIGETVSAICEKALGGVAGAVVDGLYKSSDLVIQETARLIEEHETCQRALERAFLLDLFYNKCNERIEEAEKEKGDSTWSIQAGHTVWCKQTLFGVQVLQYWRLSCDLRRTDFIYGDDEDPTNYGGVYRGTMTIDVWHDLSGFDQAFMNSVFFGSGLPYGAMRKVMRVKDEYSASSLTKTLVNANLEIHLDQKNMTSNGMTELFSLKEFSDQSAFRLNHKIIFSPNHPWWNSDGTLHKVIPTRYGPVTYHQEISPRCTCGGGLYYYNRYPQIVLEHAQILNTGKLTGPHIYEYYDQTTSESTGAVILTDYQIFNDLRQNRGMFVVLGG